MKVLQINSVCGVGSTGRIAADIHNVLTENGHSCKIAFGRGEARGVPPHDAIKIGGAVGVAVHAALSRITDRAGFYSSLSTKRLIAQIEQYDPDVVSLHNIHGYYLNVRLLFDYFRASGKPVVWTLHDCWSFTGHCAYFDYAGCSKWRTHCEECPQKQSYPSSLMFDRSFQNFAEKKKLFTGIGNLTVVTPSSWLSEYVKQSYMGHCNVKVIHNGINREVFKPSASDFRERHGLKDKIILLSVASEWEKRKGIDILTSLAKRMGDKYALVMVGTNDKIDEVLPSNVISIHRTDNQKQLAELYSAADIFVNPTLEDNFPTVNIEALACGTPVVTFDTGGSPESIDETCGAVAESKTAEGLLEGVERLLSMNVIREACLLRASRFSSN
ncbi:MAG: glycosyltransferase, partial [Oscillospiraceae bacterium]|nr:glycosyltransferase [Oscillospiraceae bacterium]